MFLNLGDPAVAPIVGAEARGFQRCSDALLGAPGQGGLSRRSDDVVGDLAQGDRGAGEARFGACRSSPPGGLWLRTTTYSLPLSVKTFKI